MNQQKISTLSSQTPWENFPSKKGQQTPEKEFTDAFAKAYLRNHTHIHSKSKRTESTLLREVPISKSGISDLIATVWEPENISNSLDSTYENYAADFTIRAFESKIKDWKAGIKQAMRYKRFSDASFVVLPLEILSRAEEHLQTFKKVNIGLWGFKKETGYIKTLFTPRPSKPLSESKRKEALRKSMKYSTSLPNP